MKYFDGSTTTTTSYTHNDGNQLTMRTVGNHEYSYFYDNNGNMTSEEHIPGPVREFTWNEDDRLTEVVRDEYGSASYVYDALGRRIVRTSGTTSTFYYYDGLMVIAEKQKVGEGNWDWQRIFTTGPGVIGNIFRISEKSGETWSDTYYHYDAIGNVVLRTNGYGGVLESIDQEAYGNVQVGSQSGRHLTAKEYDTTSALYYFNARWFDNVNGNFISKDFYSIKWQIFSNSYDYSLNNPMTYVDNNGLKPSKPSMERCRQWLRNAEGQARHVLHHLAGNRSPNAPCNGLKSFLDKLAECDYDSLAADITLFKDFFDRNCRKNKCKGGSGGDRRCPVYQFEWDDIDPRRNPFLIPPLIPILIAIPGPQPLLCPSPIPILL